ncbi:TetR/AcrR family transcriptional regulator [Rhodococcus artemisiae]|uniref:Helix-turn-helix domain-containing protein n=1 Tax=Rhodococcus artemisiae TaxID=714159 RepID=A0ABU7LFP1_9NOCA|nr:helix-turn-helix domain-containing protein [Rhodococcus artemisiae]MEE2060371.1 helix-turn-helix domain-containing protein [Rhodococcus artemisiae]
MTLKSQARVPDLRERRRQETRLEISKAALELFELQGFAATTVEEIARAAGVSSSTFFRCFATKEESVCGPDRELETEIVEWLESIPQEDINLPGIEAFYERSLQRLMTSSEDTRDRILRTRRLIASDNHLRAAAFAADALAMCRITMSVAERLRGLRSESFARLLVESAGVASRIAFDTWVRRIERGEDADLVEIYRTTRTDLREVVT